MAEVELDRRRRPVEAEARAAGGGERAPEVAARGEQAEARLALAAGAGLELARLLEGVDADLRVGADRDRDARRAVAQRREVAVAEVALGRRAADHRGAALAEQRDVALVDVDAVHDACRGAEEAGALEQLDRRAAVLGGALVELATLLARVDVADEAVLVRVGADRLDPARGNGANAVRGDADVDPARVLRRRAQRVDALEEGLDVGIAEAPLALDRGKVPAVPAAAVVGGGDQHDLQAMGARGLGQGDRHRVGLGVRAPVGLVVDVVELADRAVARVGHLAVGARAGVAHRVGVVFAGEAEHLGAPAPEVVGPVRSRRRALARAAQVDLERVAVRVDHRRDVGGRAHRARILHAASGRTCAGRPSMNTAATGLRPKR